MKKGLVIIFILVLIIIASISGLYLNSVKPMKEAENKAVQIALDKTRLQSIDDFSVYNGEKTCYVIQGKDDKGQKMIIWVPEKKGNIVVKKASDGLSRQQVLNKVVPEIGKAQIISVKLGMEKGIPLWEVYSKTNNQLLNYYSIEFESGKFLKKIENL